jgi:hypothetical protein
VLQREDTTEPLERNENMSAVIDSPVTAIVPPISLFDLPGCNITPISLTIEPWIEFDQWEAIGRALEVAEMAVQWWIGDWLNHGQEHFKDKYAQVLDAHKKTGIPVETLRAYQWVADKVKSVTRVTGVPWAVHREVATLPGDEQARILAGATEEKKPSRVVAKEAARARRRLGIDPTDQTILREPETVSWLTSLRTLLSDQEPIVPPKATFLRGMIHAMMGVIDGQLERDVEGDCLAVREAVKEILGTDDEIYAHLQSRFYFMSDPQLDDALTLLIEQGRILKKEAEGRKVGQKGKMVDIYLPIPNDVDSGEDFPGVDAL